MKLPASIACTALFGLVLLSPGNAQAQTVPTRAQVQHLLRRFAFSAPPETVTAVMQGGIAAWLTAQENPSTLDDSGTQLETLPTTLNANGSFADYNIFERVVMQHMVLTPRQLQAKMELHWLDHFAVGQGKVGDPAVMYHYDQTIRALALGNFTTLMTAVAREPAMLEWLDNNWNVGPIANENFSRESMQLYTMGTTDLNMDGSPVLRPDSTPRPNYQQAGVQEVAKAMTGYGVVYDNTNPNPQTRFSTKYFPGNHYIGPLTFLGATRDVPTDGTAIDYVIKIMTTRPSVAPFQVRELLQRFVTETPSATYINDIAKIWRAKENAPDQIAQVITAIVNHPEFNTAYHAMPKQPVELVIGALRQMPGRMQATANVSPGGSLLWELSSLGQQLFYPVSVFSFYRPGDLSSLTNTGSVLARTGVFSGISGSDPANTYTDTYIDMPTLRARIDNTGMPAVRDYLLDAFLDGGSAKLEKIIGTFLGATPSDHQIQGAMWLLLNTPDYTVN
jgi:uncharacterized protein (DUF1800 family)